MSPKAYDEMLTSIASLSKSEVKRRLLGFKGKPRLDFTESYLDKQSSDKLRHILFAAVSTRARI